jgi:hypothetical protein
MTYAGLTMLDDLPHDNGHLAFCVKMHLMPEEESTVLKRQELFKDAILSQNSDELARFMEEPLVAIAETITGALAGPLNAWKVMAGRIVQGILTGRLFQQVSREIKELREKGRIPPDYADEKKYKYGFRSWVDLLKTIDEQGPDADRLEALMAMFYGTNKANATDGEKMLSYRLFQIAKRLNSGELLLLQTLYDVFRKGQFNDNQMNLGAWGTNIAQLQGHSLTALVLKDERALMEEHLISDYRNAAVTETHQVISNSKARLTDLGIAFCQNIETYRAETKTAP